MMGDKRTIHRALSELSKNRENLLVLEEALVDALQRQEERQTNVLGTLEALKCENSELREQNERLGARIGAAVALLLNARSVYVTLVAQDALTDRSILHQIRAEIDQIDEKIKQLRENRA